MDAQDSGADQCVSECGGMVITETTQMEEGGGLRIMICL